MTNGDSCPFAAATITTPAPETGGAEDVLSKYGVVIVLVVLVALAVVLNRGGTD